MVYIDFGTTQSLITIFFNLFFCVVPIKQMHHHLPKKNIYESSKVININHITLTFFGLFFSFSFFSQFYDIAQVVIIHKHKFGKFGNIKNMKVNFYYYKQLFMLQASKL